MNRTDIRLQFACYLVVGGSAFLVELATFLLLLEAGMAVIAASVASFVVASGANYVLSNVIAFQSGGISRGQEALRFAFVALVGLGLNTGFVWLLLALGPPRSGEDLGRGARPGLEFPGSPAAGLLGPDTGGKLAGRQPACRWRTDRRRPSSVGPAP